MSEITKERRLRDAVLEVTEHDGSIWLGVSRAELIERLGGIPDETLLKMWDAEVMSRPSGASIPWTAVAFARAAIIKSLSDALEGSK